MRNASNCTEDANLDTSKQQLAQRRAAIADLDQRVTDVQPRLGLELSTPGLR